MDTVALILSIIGSLNWGLIGIFKFDLVAWLFGGQGSVVSRIIYTVVGLGSYTGADLVIPSSYKGLPVTAIGKLAFSNCERLSSNFLKQSWTEKRL